MALLEVEDQLVRHVYEIQYFTCCCFNAADIYSWLQPTQVAAKGAYLAAQRSVRLSPQPGLRSEVPGGPYVQDHVLHVEMQRKMDEVMICNGCSLILIVDCDLSSTSVDSPFFGQRMQSGRPLLFCARQHLQLNRALGTVGAADANVRVVGKPGNSSAGAE